MNISIMNEIDNTIKNRIIELAEKSYSENRYMFTDFLDMSQLSVFFTMEKEVEYAGPLVWGGAENYIRCSGWDRIKEVSGAL